MSDPAEIARLQDDRKAIKRRLNRARKEVFPHKTCGASRHTHLIVEGLIDPKSALYADLERLGYEPEHMAGSIAYVLEGLWKARRWLKWQMKVEGDYTKGGAWVLDPEAVRAELEKMGDE
jgi:hypothetical protein